MNGGSSASASPSIVTWPSCITSSSAACVLAGARLISSASSRLTNTGPRRVVNTWFFGSYSVCPVTSAGIRSGVNCMRPKVPEMVRASARTSSVLPRPGTPSTSTWPPASSAHSTWSTTSAWPTSALPISARIACGDLGRLGELLGGGLCLCVHFLPFSKAACARWACCASLMKSAPRSGPAATRKWLASSGKYPQRSQTGNLLLLRARRRNRAARARGAAARRRASRPPARCAGLSPSSSGRSRAGGRAGAGAPAARRAPPGRSAARCATATARAARGCRRALPARAALQEAPQREALRAVEDLQRRRRAVELEQRARGTRHGRSRRSGGCCANCRLVATVTKPLAAPERDQAAARPPARHAAGSRAPAPALQPGALRQRHREPPAARRRRSAAACRRRARSRRAPTPSRSSSGSDTPANSASTIRWPPRSTQAQRSGSARRASSAWRLRGSQQRAAGGQRVELGQRAHLGSPCTPMRSAKRSAARYGRSRASPEGPTRSL